MMPMTRSQGEALTALIHQLRKDWDLPGIRSALQRAAQIGSATDVATAACRCAGNPEMRTPTLIAEPGPHWQGTVAGKRPVPIMCPEHPGKPASRCILCVAAAVPRPASFVVPQRSHHTPTHHQQEAAST
jgi:hypothetical protein